MNYSFTSSIYYLVFKDRNFSYFCVSTPFRPGLSFYFLASEPSRTFLSFSLVRLANPPLLLLFRRFGFLLSCLRAVKNFVSVLFDPSCPAVFLCDSAEPAFYFLATEPSRTFLSFFSARPAPPCFFVIQRSRLSTFLPPNRQELFFRSFRPVLPRLASL
jgi:hypothetical protein